MNRPEVMKAEYVKVKSAFWAYARLAVGAIEPGDEFVYLGETEEEKQQLQADIAAAAWRSLSILRPKASGR